MAHAAEWLASARPGYCNITLSDQFGSCEFGDRGAFGLPAAAASVSWEGAASACLELCAHCHRCEYVSLSPQYRDCSWYHRCDLNALHDATFESSLAGMYGGALYAGASHSLSPPAQASFVSSLSLFSPPGYLARSLARSRALSL